MCASTRNDEASRAALHTLLSRNVWEGQDEAGVVYIDKHGLTAEQVEAVVREWFRMTDVGLADLVAVSSWSEVGSVAIGDGEVGDATRVVVTFGAD